MINKKALLNLYGLATFTELNKLDLYDDKPNFKPKPIPKGCKEFTIDGFTVVALNEKSAKRKIDKLKKL